MSKRRYALKSGNNAPYELFNDAEDAWLWASANTELMLAGARGQPSLKPTQRPCEAADMLNAFERLMRAGTLAARHAPGRCSVRAEAAPPKRVDPFRAGGRAALGGSDGSPNDAASAKGVIL